MVQENQDGFKCKSCNGKKTTPRTIKVWVDVLPNTQSGDMLAFTLENPEEMTLLPKEIKFIAEIAGSPYQAAAQSIFDFVGDSPYLGAVKNMFNPIWNERIAITPEEARLGCTKEYQHKIPNTCTQCSGTGYLKSENRPCGSCNATGFIKGDQTETIKVKIPPSLQKGMGLRLKGKGAYLSNRRRGDLFLAIDFEEGRL